MVNNRASGKFLDLLEGHSSYPMYDVIVIGAGHAGCEAALASSRMGCKTLLLTINLDNVALMPCNPSIGGPAKGHLVREIDALGGEMARNIDKTFIQIRMLNTGKGPAVQALRAQADKKLYGLSMKYTLEQQANLDLKQALVEELVIDSDGKELRVRTSTDWLYHGRCVVLTTGTSLAGKVIVGDKSYPAGRAGEFAAYGLSQSLMKLGFTLGRLKTGTPPRLDARTIDFSKAVMQPGSDIPLHFSFEKRHINNAHFPEPNPAYPPGPPTPWHPQLPCYLIYTNNKTHDIIRNNLHRAPLFTGMIQGIGPRYCPSIEDKIVKFADKEAHPLFLEPEGWQTGEVYVQGANTSLPEEVQLDMMHSIPALEKSEMVRVGYAIEYDYVPSNQIGVTLESKLIPNLFFAGQINGTTGYEEAAGQGLIAGINASLKVKEKPPLILRRDEGYIGVMLDDLTTCNLTEPYRLFTSRAEYRLILRQDNADLRLTPIGHQLGLIPDERYEAVETKRSDVARELERLSKTFFIPNNDDNLSKQSDSQENNHSVRALEYLRRPEISYQDLLALGAGASALNSSDTAEQVEIEAKYQGYIEQQKRQIERVHRMEEWQLPPDINYIDIIGLRNEARQKLNNFHPATIGQASRIDGVTPSDIGILMIHLVRRRKTSPSFSRE
ncbi:MAG: tRNA uridine-5-carboxymethylaminomethyl(34) synthesis enzyme MnmG [Dehalococcoidia bacterium]|nr:tRNA uridine-5-carboxymethylaminomethyl(34) synthesis enzyme MnmG [Dehalococcoidia bacterium]